MFSPCLIKFAKDMCLSAGNTQYEVSILNTSLGRAAALDPLSGSGCSKHTPETGWSYAAAFTVASSFAA